MITLLAVELRRALARRILWVLVAVALLGIALAGLIAYLTTGDPGDEPFRITDLWPTGDADPILGIITILAALVAFVLGASLVGAEWKANTVGTLLTWEPRRVRVSVAKLATAAIVGFGLALLLYAALSLALLPAAAAHGTTAGTDAEWWRGLIGGVLRGAAVTGFMAALGASIAMIGRNTSAGLGMAFGYLIAVEFVFQAWKPWTGAWLLLTNMFTVIDGGQLEDVEFTRTLGEAALILVLYLVVVGGLATWLFHRRDVASAS